MTLVMNMIPWEDPVIGYILYLCVMKRSSWSYVGTLFSRVAVLINIKTKCLEYGQTSLVSILLLDTLFRNHDPGRKVPTSDLPTF